VFCILNTPALTDVTPLNVFVPLKTKLPAPTFVIPLVPESTPLKVNVFALTPICGVNNNETFPATLLFPLTFTNALLAFDVPVSVNASAPNEIPP
jgi:hypothetical protein